MNWSIPGKDLERSRFSKCDCKAPPRIKWKTAQLASRLVQDEVVIEGDNALVVSSTGAVFSIDDSGKVIWKWLKKVTGSRVVAPPFLNANRAYICRESFFQCIDVLTGEELWRVAAQKGKDVNDGKSIAPDEWDFAKGVLGVCQDSIVVGSLRGVLREIDCKSGKVLKRKPLWSTYLASAGNHVLACVRADRSSQGIHQIVNLETFEALGNLSDIIGGRPGFCSLDDSGFIANGRGVAAFRMSDGKILWKSQQLTDSRDPAMRLARDARALYWLQGNTMSALDVHDGRLIWESVAESVSFGERNFAVGDKYIYLIRQDNNIEILNKETGRSEWCGDVIGKENRPVSLSLSNNLLYVLCERMVVCLSAD